MAASWSYSSSIAASCSCSSLTEFLAGHITLMMVLLFVGQWSGQWVTGVNGSEGMGGNRWKMSGFSIKYMSWLAIASSQIHQSHKYIIYNMGQWEGANLKMAKDCGGYWGNHSVKVRNTIQLDNLLYKAPAVGLLSFLLWGLTAGPLGTGRAQSLTATH